MKPLNSNPDPESRQQGETAVQTAELQKAFAAFNQVSAELTQAYAALEQRASSLTEELAIANGELRRQFLEKEALSERLSLLLNALPAGVVVLDGGGVVTQANPTAGALFGHDVVGRHWGDVARDFLEPTMTVGEWQLGDRRMSLAESPLDSAGGKLLLVHDISQAHQMKAELERSQRLAAMGEMAASLAHQIRTPLAAALLYSSNLGQAQLPDAARQKFAEKVTSQLRRLERLIQDTLLFARGESLGRDVFAIGDLLQEVAQTVEPLARELGVNFSFDDPSSSPVVVGTRKSLYGALINLLENALQHCEAGRTVDLSVSWQEDLVSITVRDEGPGVPAQMRQRIFEPFFTTRGLGTGLGLSIALGVARAHGGNIELMPERSTGRGAEFVLTLPLAAQELRDNADV